MLNSVLSGCAVPYTVVSQREHGGYRCETKAADLGAAIAQMLSQAQSTRRRHYIVDDSGRLVDICHPH
jgi:hypothetical protein